MQNEELLDNFNFQPEEDAEVYLVPASLGKRLLNYIIDRIALRAIVFFFGIFITDPYFISNLEVADMVFLIVLLLAALIGYFWVGEHLLGGRTLGKLITNTKVVDDYDGTRPSGTNILIRTLARAVPFEPFSILFNEDKVMWHDTWSRTLVVDVKKSTLPAE